MSCLNRTESPVRGSRNFGKDRTKPDRGNPNHVKWLTTSVHTQRPLRECLGKPLLDRLGKTKSRVCSQTYSLLLTITGKEALTRQRHDPKSGTSSEQMPSVKASLPQPSQSQNTPVTGSCSWKLL